MHTLLDSTKFCFSVSVFQNQVFLSITVLTTLKEKIHLKTKENQSAFSYDLY
jgi:hypothetical protein